MGIGLSSPDRLTFIDPEDFGNFSELTHLVLPQCDLFELPDSFSNLKKVELLDLGGNKFETFPKIIAELRSLVYLSINPEAIRNVPDSIKDLSNLRMLAIGSAGKLESWNNEVHFPYYFSRFKDRIDPEDLYKFRHVKRLDLSGIPSENIKNINFEMFSELRELGLFGCQLESIPESIFGLSHLEVLDIGENKIDFLPQKLLQLKSLKYLFATRNNILVVPPELLELNFESDDEPSYYRSKNFLSFDLRKNPIKNVPQEIINRGYSAINNYFESIEKEAVTSINSAKLMIVGRGRVGKTSLVKKLVDPERLLAEDEEKTTRGIDIKKWRIDGSNGETFDTRIWDFGGQQSYYTPHQFFLTRRSLYLLVWDALQEEDELTFSHWLNLIKIMSDNSPVIIVMNKADIRKKSIKEQGLKDTFPNIVSFHQVSSITGEGIKDLRNEIVRELFHLPHVSDKLPFSWKYIRDDLEALGKTKSYISEQDYCDLCANFNLNQDQAYHLSNYLHDLGTIIHNQKDLNLLNTVVLNPEWLTNAIYAIVDDHKIIENNGEFGPSDIKRIWGEKLSYPQEKYGFLIQLMQRSELCFENKFQRTYTVPSLLAPDPPVFQWSISDDIGLRFEYEYKFIPTGIMTKFIARNFNTFGQGHKIWQHGVFFSSEGIEILVQESLLDKKLMIHARGDQNLGDKLTWLREELDSINKSYSKLDIETNVSCVCSDCCKSDQPYMFNVNSLKRRLQKGKTEVECDISYEDLSVGKLLKTYDLRLEGFKSLPGEDLDQHYIPGVKMTLEQISEKFDRGDIRKIIEVYFSEADLKNLCFDLNIDYEILPSNSKSDFARELISHCERRGIGKKLLEEIALSRPEAFL